MKKFRNYWLSLDEDTVINRKLLLFEILTAILAGIVLGFILAPFKSLTILPECMMIRNRATAIEKYRHDGSKRMMRRGYAIAAQRDATDILRVVANITPATRRAPSALGQFRASAAPREDATPLPPLNPNAAG